MSWLENISGIVYLWFLLYSPSTPPPFTVSVKGFLWTFWRVISGKRGMIMAGKLSVDDKPAHKWRIPFIKLYFKFKTKLLSTINLILHYSELSTRKTRAEYLSSGKFSAKILITIEGKNSLAKVSWHFCMCLWILEKMIENSKEKTTHISTSLMSARLPFLTSANSCVRKL